MNFALNDLGAAVLSNAVLAVPLALLAAMVCRLVKSPSAAWCLWGLVLLKFVTPAWYPVVPLQTRGVSTNQEAPTAIDASLLEDSDPRVRRPVSSPAAHHGQIHEPTPGSFEGPADISPDPVAGEPVAPGISRNGPSELLFGPRNPTDNGGPTLAASHRSEWNAPPPPPLPVPNDSRGSVPTVAESLPLEVDTGDTYRLPAAENPASGSVNSQRVEHRTGDNAGSRDFGLAVSPALPPLLIAVWASGAIVLWILTVIRARRFRRLVRLAEPAPAELVERAAELAAKLGSRTVPRLRVTDGRVPPLLWGIGRRAVILLPRELLDELDDEQRSALLAHELAHYTRLDHWTRWFELAVRSLWWWHPVAWWAGRRLREAEEQCCDAWVLRLLDGPDAPRRYADALLKTVDYLSAARPVPTVATGITPVRRSLRPFHRRLTMIIETRPKPNLSWPARVCLLAIAAAVLPISIAAVGEERRVHEATRNAPNDAHADAGVHSTPFYAPYEAAGVDDPAPFSTFTTEAPRPNSDRTKIIADEQTNTIIVSGTQAELEAVEEIVEAVDGERESTTDALQGDELQPPTTTTADAPQGTFSESSSARGQSETITVVRATYQLPAPIVKALNEFIRQHGPRFEFLVSVEATAAQSGMGIMFGGFEAPSPRLVIIATPKVQQQFGDFIRAIQSSSKLFDSDGAAKPVEPAETLTVVKAMYRFRRPITVKAPPGTEVNIRFGRLGGGFTQLPANDGESRISLGRDMFELVTAVKQANLVPLLVTTVVNSTPGEVSFGVTTTEEFQQALGKFIRFLQKHQPEVTGDKHARDRVPPELQQRIERKLEEQHKARQRNRDERDENRIPPEFRRRSDANVNRSEQSAAAQRLAALKMEEQELQALLKATEEGIQNGVDRAALLLVIQQLYGPTGDAGDLIRTSRQLRQAEARFQELKAHSHQDDQEFKQLKNYITELRASQELPTGDDAKPVDVLDIYQQAIRQQLKVTRAMIKVLENVVKHLEERDKHSSIERRLRDQKDKDIRSLEWRLKMADDQLRLIEEGIKAGGNLEALNRLIEYFQSESVQEEFERRYSNFGISGETLATAVIPRFEAMRREQELLREENPNQDELRGVRERIEAHMRMMPISAPRGQRHTDYLQLYVANLRQSVAEDRARLRELKSGGAKAQDRR